MTKTLVTMYHKNRLGDIRIETYVRETSETKHTPGFRRPSRRDGGLTVGEILCVCNPVDNGLLLTSLCRILACSHSREAFCGGNLPFYEDWILMGSAFAFCLPCLCIFCTRPLTSSSTLLPWTWFATTCRPFLVSGVCVVTQFFLYKLYPCSLSLDLIPSSHRSLSSASALHVAHALPEIARTTSTFRSIHSVHCIAHHVAERLLSTHSRHHASLLRPRILRFWINDRLVNRKNDTRRLRRRRQRITLVVAWFPNTSLESITNIAIRNVNAIPFAVLLRMLSSKSRQNVGRVEASIITQLTRDNL
jgi:hypothetical protein